MTMIERVVAVGNAFCAFSKDLVGAFCASTGPAASMRRWSSPSPHARGLNAVPTFVEAAESHRTKMQIPEAIVNRLEPDVFPDQHGTHRQATRVPGDPALGTDATNFIMARVFQRRQPRRQRARRRRIQTRGLSLGDAFMRALAVIDPAKSGEPPLLSGQVGARRAGGFRLQRA